MAAFRMRAADRPDCRDLPGRAAARPGLNRDLFLVRGPRLPATLHFFIPASLLYLRWLPTPTPSALGGVWSF